MGRYEACIRTRSEESGRGRWALQQEREVLLLSIRERRTTTSAFLTRTLYSLTKKLPDAAKRLGKMTLRGGAVSVHPDVAEVALDRVEGFPFERFVNDLYPLIIGKSYVPIGGFKDGGADAFGGDPLHQRVGRPTYFYQASIRPDVKVKIRHTIKRLKEYDREVRSLTYLTSRKVQTLDQVEAELSDELDVSIRIHDAKYIISLLNQSKETQACYERHLAHLTDFLRHVGQTTLISSSQFVKDPTVLVYLRQETDKRKGDTQLIESLTDTLILWALEGTDPDKNVLMSQKDILLKVEGTIPTATREIASKLDHRLKMMSSKDFPGGRRVRYHRKDDAYVLPYETRRSIEESNANDEALTIRVREGLIARAVLCSDEELTAKEQGEIGEISMRTMQIAFEKQGLLLSHFLASTEGSTSDTEYPAIVDAVRDAVFEYSVPAKNETRFTEIAIRVARECMYSSTEDEREYLRRLSRTYTLLFTLKNEPQVVEFFQRMASDFYLYVGTDMLVRALSELFLEVADQPSRNTLRMAAESGMKLILTEPVLDEVLGNLRGSDREYQETYAAIEESLDDEMISAVPKIMLRTYLYNRKRNGGASNWPAFVERFCSYGSLNKREARPELKTYLLKSFAMEYKSFHDLHQITSGDEVVELAASLRPIKPSDNLATNDATLICAVYGHRREAGEGTTGSEFGFNTWWLTGETRVLRVTGDIVRRNDNSRYMISPNFLLNFLSLAPSASAVRESYANIFPGMLGVQISRQMDEEAYISIIERVTEAQQLEEARRAAVLAKLSDEVKSNLRRPYVLSLPPYNSYGRR